MNRILCVLSLAMLTACDGIREPSPALPTAPGLQAASPAAPALPGRYIVTVREGASAHGVAQAHGIQPHHLYAHALKGFAGSIPDAARARLLRDGRVLRVEPDGVATTAGAQSNAPWGLDRVDQRALPLSGSYTYGGSGVGVTTYVIDTGIRYDHQEFGGRAVFGYDVLGGDGSDCNGHGTHVAGIAGGATYGVAKGASLVSVRVLDCGGSGTWSGVIAGLDWIAANRTLPAVANLSLVGSVSQSVDDAVRRVIESGVPVVIAAGNQGADACGYSPARVPEAMTVGATTPQDARASFSNHGDCIDWFAPGESIPSAWYTGSTAVNTRSGTSMAAPHAAGVAALFLEAYTGASPQAVRDTLLAAASRGIVSGASAANNHLLFSRITNLAPTAKFSVSCAELACSFTDQSSDDDGALGSWSWSFGDGLGASARHPSHTYPASGVYQVSLSITDDAGGVGTATQSVRAVRIALSARGYKVKGEQRVDLAWSGALAGSVDLWRDGTRLTTTANDGAHTDVLGPKGAGAYTYRVCEAGTSSCSPEARATF